MKSYPGTLAILVLLSAMFVLETATGAAGNHVVLLRLGALPTDGSAPGQYWRIVSFSLLHLTQLHLGVNLMGLWLAGRILEPRVGTARAIAIYACSVVAGGVAILAASAIHPQPGYAVGASAGTFGLLGAALVLVHRRDAAPLGRDRGLRLALWACLVVALAMSLLPGISLAGHLGGMGPGLLAAATVRLKRDATIAR